ncbi:hypothetical protein CROQUDRAFT_40291 [Cronartium quercuum f. sp. fusiforme G11]|uniref:Uncharacterized protein n=1 Tax=Cronartium quercuum f. sp. fusiforme G11 TaxID=708437 RepID=A0A9P6NL75_9BASI|nr:hypothetical protein CROQUDRAFT_40291 [Cronartium quercuum f. sp. fusiforme G11]
MQSYQLLSFIVVAFASGISADVFNNYQNARIIQSTAVVPPDGRYVFSNAGNGQIIQHNRDGNVPNIYPAKFTFPRGRHGHQVKRPQLALRAHKMGTKWISLRTPLDGSDSTKCISAQWDDKTDGAKGGADHAGTLYECVVDPLNLGASLEKTKQWWLLMPVKAAQLLKSGRMSQGKSRKVQSGDDESPTDAPALGKQLSVKHSKETSLNGMPFWNTKTNRMEALPPWKYDKRSLPETDDDEQVSIVGNHSGNQSDEDRSGEHNGSPKTAQRHWIRSHHKAQVATHSHHGSGSSSTKLGPFYVISVDHLYVSD